MWVLEPNILPTQSLVSQCAVSMKDRPKLYKLHTVWISSVVHCQLLTPTVLLTLNSWKTPQICVCAISEKQLQC